MTVCGITLDCWHWVTSNVAHFGEKPGDLTNLFGRRTFCTEHRRDRHGTELLAEMLLTKLSPSFPTTDFKGRLKERILKQPSHVGTCGDKQ